MLHSIALRMGTVAGPICALAVIGMAAPAGAKVTTLYTISDYQPTRGIVSESSIESVTGSFTMGTTAADDTSAVTVVEDVGGPLYTYDFTGREDSPSWSQVSQFNPCCKASFGINPVEPFGVSTGVSVSLTDFIYGGTGSVTITATPYTGTPEPATWAVMLAGLIGVGGAIRRTRRQMAAATA